jgi:protein ERP2
MTVQGPRGQQLHNIAGQSHAEISIKPVEIGEHSICFTHGSSATDKTLDIDVTLTNQDGSAFVVNRPDESGKVLTQASADAATQALESTVSKLNKDLAEISHTLKYLKNREKRNSETVNSIDRVIFGFSLFETVLIFGMSLCQVAILRHFFGRSGRPRV